MTELSAFLWTYKTLCFPKNHPSYGKMFYALTKETKATLQKRKEEHRKKTQAWLKREGWTQEELNTYIKRRQEEILKNHERCYDPKMFNYI